MPNNLTRLEITRDDLDSLVDSVIREFNQSHESIKDSLGKFLPFESFHVSRGKFETTFNDDGSLDFLFPKEPKIARLIIEYGADLEPSISIDENRSHLKIGFYLKSNESKNPSAKWSQNKAYAHYHDRMLLLNTSKSAEDGALT